MRIHPVNVAHLVFGLVFLGVAGSWVLAEAGVVSADPGWVVPLVLVLAGAVGLVASLAKGLPRPGTGPAEAASFEPPAYDPPPYAATPENEPTSSWDDDTEDTAGMQGTDATTAYPTQSPTREIESP